MNKSYIRQFESFTSDYSEKIGKILEHLFNEISAQKSISSVVEVKKNLFIGKRKFAIKDKQIFVVGAGKASADMAVAVNKVLGSRIKKGLIITKKHHSKTNKIGNIEVIEASHPIPDWQGVLASQKLLKIVSGLTKDDLVLVLISGGGSALTTLPAESLRLEDLQKLTGELLNCGASINEINCLRKHLTQISGGKLAVKAQPAKVISLIISDVIDSPLDVIASGMTSPDPTSFNDAWEILKKYELIDKTASTIIEYLQKGMKGEISETPKSDNKIWDNVHNFVIADNVRAVKAAVKKAKDVGFKTQVLTTYLAGEAREVGRVFASIGKEYAQKNIKKPMMLIAGGETTVTVRGKGTGGRNQEIALGAVQGLAGLENVVLISLATDGGDGLTDVAGAIVDGKTLEKAQRLNLSPDDFLQRSDSYNFFLPLNLLIKTGPTLTNVNDLLFLFIFPNLKQTKQGKEQKLNNLDNKIRKNRR